MTTILGKQIRTNRGKTMWALFFCAVDLCWTVNQWKIIYNLSLSISPSISWPCWFDLFCKLCWKGVAHEKFLFFRTNPSEVEQKQFGADQKSDRMENFALGQQISNGLVRNWKYLESYDFPFKNLNILIASILAPEQNEYRLQLRFYEKSIFNAKILILLVLCFLHTYI